jgi:hypothetical protein
VKSSGQDPEQVSVGKTSGSKPFEDASLTYQELSKPEVMLSAGTSGDILNAPKLAEERTTGYAELGDKQE